MMPIARMHKQRKVTRASWKPRFSKQRMNWRGTSKFARPTLASIAPTTAVAVTGADFTLTCTGTGFVAGVTVIVFNGGDERTTFVSATSVTTIVKPSLVGSPITLQVDVRNGPLLSGTSKAFTFTATGLELFEVGEHTIVDTHTYVDVTPTRPTRSSPPRRLARRSTLITWLQGSSPTAMKATSRDLSHLSPRRRNRRVPEASPAGALVGFAYRGGG
jgi:hypothetical protein